MSERNLAVLQHNDVQESSTTKIPKRRTKSGCLTCRKRRIKCGEEKPVCRNCTRTKRTCDQPRPTTSTRGQTVQSGRKGQGTLDGRFVGSVLAAETYLPDSSLLFESDNNATTKGTIYASSQGSSQDSTHSPELSYRTSSQSPPEHMSTFLQVPPRDVPAHSLSDDFSFLGGAAISDVALSGSLPDESTLNSILPLLSPPIRIGADAGYFPSADIGQYMFDARVSQHEPVQLLPPSTPQRKERVRDLAPRPGVRRYYSSGTISVNPASASLSSGSRSSLSPSHAGSDAAAKTKAPYRLTERQNFYLSHFIREVNMNFTSIQESAIPNQVEQVKESNFWSFVIPGMAVHSMPLLHAVLAISALHEANITRNSEHQALMDYHQAIRKLVSELQTPGALLRDDLLAACLILAYFETMGGEALKWGRHLQGACDMVRTRIQQDYGRSHRNSSDFTTQPSISDHLIWFHIHQDSVQAILSGSGLLLKLEYIEMCPVRGHPGSITHVSDQLRVLLARVGDFAFKDRLRKEEFPGDTVALDSAISHWNMLMEALNELRTGLPAAYAAKVVLNASTPFGPIFTYRHPAIASFQIMALAATLCLHRAHPSLSPVPADAIRATASITYVLEQDIARILSGIMVEAVNNDSIDNGLHVKAMISASMPILLAGVATTDPDQRAYLERMLQDVYSFTGWRTILRVLQGFDVAWQRSVRPVDGLPSLDHDGQVQRERTYDSSRKHDYVVMDKAESLNSAQGVLGKLEIFRPEAPFQRFASDRMEQQTMTETRIDDGRRRLDDGFPISHAMNYHLADDSNSLQYGHQAVEGIFDMPQGLAQAALEEWA